MEQKISLSINLKTEDVSHEAHSQSQVKQQPSCLLTLEDIIAAIALLSSSFADKAWLIVDVELICRRALSTGLSNSRSG